PYFVHATNERRMRRLRCRYQLRLRSGRYRGSSIPRPSKRLAFPDACGMALGARLGMKNIGKPCTGKPYARFDEGGQANTARSRLWRHRQTKGAETDRPKLRAW